MERNAIPFNKPYMTGKELFYIARSYFNGQLAGDGPFTKKCHGWLETSTGADSALLTHSCTAALEMSAILLNLKPGDEVIMPSYTFVSTANAFVLRGAVPVFVDIRSDTLNLDETLIEEAITPRTRAIVPVHYAGVACDMDAIMEISAKYNLYVVEDAAQGMMASYKGRALGTIGDLGTLSFHETKNIISGEGGALLINNPKYISRSEVIREKGTDRSRYFRGEVDKYTWQDVGSSFLPGELIAAFLWAQLEQAESVTKARLDIWDQYHALLDSLENEGKIRRPIVPSGCQHNAHMYYVILNSERERDVVLRTMRKKGIGTVFHYIPLHSSPAGIKYGRVHAGMSVTDDMSSRIIRLPLWQGISYEKQAYVVDTLASSIV